MTLDLLALGVGGLGLWRADPRERSLLLLGALVIGVASASLLQAAGQSSTRDVVRLATDPAGLIFLQGVAGLVLLGLVLCLLSGARGPALLAVPAGLVLLHPFLEVPGIVRAVGIGAAVLALAVLGWVILLRLRPGRLLVALDRALLDPREHGGWRPAAGWTPEAPILAAGVAGLAALLVPHLWTVLGGAVVATIAAAVAMWRGGRRPWLLVLAALLLGLALLWTVRLSGPLGGWIPTLVDGPFSPRAAQWLTVLVAGAGLVLAGLWPLHGATVPVLLAPVAVAVVGVFGVLLIPDGLRWWQPLLAPLTLVAMMHAVARERHCVLLVGGGLLGFWSGTNIGLVGGALLVATGWVLAVAPVTWVGRIAWPRLVGAAIGLGPLVGALLVLRAGLGTESAYTLAAVGIVAGALGQAGLDRGAVAATR